MVHFISKLLEFLCGRVSYCTILLHSPLSDRCPTPNTGDEWGFVPSVALRRGAFVLANIIMTNPHLAPPSPVGGGGGGGNGA